MADDILNCIEGEIHSNPDLKRIRLDMEAHKGLWEFALYECEEDIPRRECPLQPFGDFTIYLVARNKPRGVLMTIVSRWQPTRLEWLDRFGKLDHLCNVLSGAAMSANAILMISWDDLNNG